METPTVNPTVTTTYTVSVNDGFTTIEGDVTVTVHPLPVPNAGPDQSIPYGTPAMLFGSGSLGSGSYSYYWSPGNKISSGQNTPTPVTVNLIENTLFELVITDALTGCVCAGPDLVEVAVTGVALHVNPAVEPEVICQGEQAQLFSLAGGGTNNLDYSWTSYPPGFVSDQPNPPISPNMTTTYYCSVYDGYNTVEGEVTITVNPKPLINFSDEITVCVFDTVTLDAGDPGPGSTYLWTNGSTDRVVKLAATGIGFDVTSLSVTVTSPAGCQATDQCVVYFDFAECAGIDDPVEDHGLRIYPNPGSGLLKIINTGKYRNLSLTITDMTGRKVVDGMPVSFSAGNNVFTIDLKSNPAGIYLVRLNGDGKPLFRSKYLLER
jgi:hypothetical protein